MPQPPPFSLLTLLCRPTVLTLSHTRAPCPCSPPALQRAALQRAALRPPSPGIPQGCDTFTISPVVAGKLFNVGYTIDAAADFEAAARRNGAYEPEPATAGPKP